MRLDSIFFCQDLVSHISHDDVQTHQEHANSGNKVALFTSEAPCRWISHSICNLNDGKESISWALIDSNLNLFGIIKLILYIDEIIRRIALSFHLKWLECVGISTTESKHLGFYVLRSKPHILGLSDLLPSFYSR